MGNYRFKLSDMVSSGWLYKLREMGRAKSHDNSQEKQHITPTPTTTTTSSSLSSSSSSLSAKTRKARQFSTRKSYYFTRGLVPPENLYKHLPDPPRKSSKQRARKTKSPNQSSPKLVSSSGCSCRATLWTKPDSPLEYAASSSFYTPDCSPEAEVRADCVLATKPFDQMVSMKSRPCRFRVDEPPEMGKFLNLELPPIITKAGKVDATAEESKKTERQKEPSWKTGSVSIKIVEEEQRSHPMRRVWVSSPGVKLRVNSPKLARRRTQAPARKSWSLRRSLGESTAVVKSSADPRRDFRESMVEMIRANNIKGSKDLEDLLACYLSLNSDEYHDLIINVFKQIWLDLNDVRSLLK